MNDIELAQAELLASGKPLFDNVDEVIRKWLIINDFGVTKILPAVLIANFMPGHPVWMFLVAGSSSGKTELMASLNGRDDTYALASMTPNTFISGMKGYKGILQEITNKVVTFKDFTTILETQQDARNMIMSQLREIYDGEYSRKTGTGENNKAWTGKIGLIAGVTPIIDYRESAYSALGERFIKYRITPPDRKAITRRALLNTTHVTQMRDEIKAAMSALLDKAMEYVPKKDADGKYSDEVNNRELGITDNELDALVDLSEMATRARSAVIRDYGMTKEVIGKPDSEAPARFAQQLAQLSQGLKVINKANGGEEAMLEIDHKILYKIALDSIPSMRRQVLQKLAEVGTGTTGDIAMSLNLPTNVTGRNLEDINILGLASRSKSGNANEWTINDNYRQILVKYDDVKTVMTAEEKALAIAETEKEIKAQEEATLYGIMNHEQENETRD